MGYDSILIPTDGSEHADLAADHALSVASAFDASVHVLGVVDLVTAAGPFDAGGVDEEVVDRLQEDAREAVQRVGRRWEDADRLREEVRNGVPSDEILEYIEEADIDVVAMGTHGRTGLRRFVLGSVTEHVLRESPVPVLATRATEEYTPTFPYTDVVVSTDGSDCARAAVEHALSVTEAYGARLHAVHVVDVGSFETGPGGPLPSEYLDSVERAGTEATEEIETLANDRGVDVETAVERGRASDAIASYADTVDADLLVMGTHGRSGLERFLLGSTTERLIRRSDRPVLAVPGGRGVDGSE